SNTSEFSQVWQIVKGSVSANSPPTPSAGGPYAINEGDGLTLNATASLDPDGDLLSYSWDVNGEGVFGDATGVTPILAWQQLQTPGIHDGPASFAVRVRVNDGQGPDVTSGPASLMVQNVTVNVVERVADLSGPKVVLVRRAGIHRQATQIILT